MVMCYVAGSRLDSSMSWYNAMQWCLKSAQCGYVMSVVICEKRSMAWCGCRI